MSTQEEYLREKEQACGLDKGERYELDELSRQNDEPLLSLLSNKTFEVEWLYEDELNEHPNHRFSNILSIHTDTALGQAIGYCQDKENYEALDAILKDEFGLVDDDIVFYLEDINDEDDEAIKAKLRESNNMVVYGLSLNREEE